MVNVLRIVDLTYSCRRSKGGRGHDDGDESGELHFVVGTGVESALLRMVRSFMK
jgi:hypothetical protein